MTPEQTNAEQTTDATTASNFRNQFSYSVGEYAILLESEVRSEVVDTREISDLPFSPAWCAGLASSRGELYPVMDMHRVFLDKASPVKIKFLLIHHPKFLPIILACDGFSSQLDVPITDSNTLGDESLPAWITHSISHNDQTLLVADHARLLRHIQRAAA